MAMPQTNPVEDQQAYLLQRLAGQDCDAWSEFYDQRAPAILSFGLRLLDTRRGTGSVLVPTARMVLAKALNSTFRNSSNCHDACFWPRGHYFVRHRMNP